MLTILSPFSRERHHVQNLHPASADHTLSPTVATLLFYSIAIVAMALCQGVSTFFEAVGSDFRREKISCRHDTRMVYVRS